MRKLIGIGLGLVLLAAGLGGLGMVSDGIRAAQLSQFTGPAGTNPAQNPPLVGDLNTVINGINGNAAFAGTGTPSQALGVNSVTTNTIGSGSGNYEVLQIMGAVATTTTGSSAACHVTGASGCFAIEDSNGILRWIAF